MKDNFTFRRFLQGSSRWSEGENKESKSRRQGGSYRNLIWFVWLWESSRGHARKKVGFHKIMQTTVNDSSLSKRDYVEFIIKVESS